MAQQGLQVDLGLCVCLSDRRHGAVQLDESLEVGIGAIGGLFRLRQSADIVEVPV